MLPLFVSAAPRRSSPRSTQTCAVFVFLSLLVAPEASVVFLPPGPVLQGAAEAFPAHGVRKLLEGDGGSGDWDDELNLDPETSTLSTTSQPDASGHKSKKHAKPAAPWPLIHFRSEQPGEPPPQRIEQLPWEFVNVGLVFMVLVPLMASLAVVCAALSTGDRRQPKEASAGVSPGDGDVEMHVRSSIINLRPASSASPSAGSESQPACSELPLVSSASAPSRNKVTVAAIAVANRKTSPPNMPPRQSFLVQHARDQQMCGQVSITGLESPFSSKLQDEPRLASIPLLLCRLVRICMPSIYSKAGALLIGSVCFSLVVAFFDALVMLIIVKTALFIVDSGEGDTFCKFIVFMLVYNFMLAQLKAVANFFSYRTMALWRQALVRHLHDLYMSEHGKLYYTMGNLDSRVSAPDARITNDTDLLMQFLFEFVLGGIMKIDGGVCVHFFQMAFTIGIAYVLGESANPGAGWFAPVVSVCVFAVSCVPTVLTASLTSKAQSWVQDSEAAFRRAHANCASFAESVCFYGGESTEAGFLDAQFRSVTWSFQLLAGRKFFLELNQLGFYYGNWPVSGVIAAIVVRCSSWETDSEIQANIQTFWVLTDCTSKVLRCAMDMTKSVLDFAKATAMLKRVGLLVEVMEEFHLFTSTASNEHPKIEVTYGIGTVQRCPALYIPYYRVKPLSCSPLAVPELSVGLGFDSANVYTPDATRLLLPNVTFSLAPGESCLIMGPSGIGKSSLLRVLGRLWPLFQRPRGEDCLASFSRPGPRGLFFLAQRPYLFEGTLREQVAYPIWEESVLTELDNEALERLFREAHLHELWARHGGNVDAVGLAWDEILSLGEQQRLQFCRLFWHYEWCTRHSEPGVGFFAVLDESTASMDADSEMTVYGTSRQKGFGYLSVAHRPTVIQFHSKVLEFVAGKDGHLQAHVRDAAEKVHEAARQLTSKGEFHHQGHLPKTPSDSGEEGQKFMTPAKSGHRSATSRRTYLSYNDLTPVAEDEPDEGTLVTTPYSSAPCDGTLLSGFGCVMRLGWLCQFNAISPGPRQRRAHLLLIGIAVCNFYVAVTWGSYAVVITRFSKTINPAIPGFAGYATFIICHNLSTALMKATANVFAMHLMVIWRAELIRRLHGMYLCPHSRLYYTLSNLDARVDSPEQRITNDVDLLMQYFFEFLAGGVFKPDSGILLQVCTFIWCVGTVRHEILNSPGAEGLAAVIPPGALLFGLICFLPIYRLSHTISSAQEVLQVVEGLFRQAHARCRLFAEGICFYGGEVSEKATLERRLEAIYRGLENFAWKKFPLEVCMLLLFQGIFTISNVLGGLVAFSVNPSTEPGAPSPNIARTQIFTVVNKSVITLIMTNINILNQVLDLAKMRAMLKRVSELYEIMEAFMLYESRKPEQEVYMDEIVALSPLIRASKLYSCVPYYIRQLHHGRLVPLRRSPGIVFENADIYTPCGSRILMPRVSLHVAPAESCLIMGPSGIGKSSLLRVLGGLWPLFATPNVHDAFMSRPGRFNVFFLAQRPYIFEGTLREQVAYPVWEDSVLTELSDEVMLSLFLDANLGDVWEKRRNELDNEDICWSDVLSLGEQQRLQFCRLFWHAQWHKKHGELNEGFFAVLDESTASMDTESEMKVYESCRQRNFGFLSVAHRPTVIQYHSKVLLFEYSATGELMHSICDSQVVSQQALLMLTRHMQGKKEGNND